MHIKTPYLPAINLTWRHKAHPNKSAIRRIGIRIGCAHACFFHMKNAGENAGAEKNAGAEMGEKKICRKNEKIDQSNTKKKCFLLEI
jgi:hypothetical protein